MADVQTPAPVREPPHYRSGDRDCGCGVSQRLDFWTTRLRDWLIALVAEQAELRSAVERTDVTRILSYSDEIAGSDILYTGGTWLTSGPSVTLTLRAGDRIQLSMAAPIEWVSGSAGLAQARIRNVTTGETVYLAEANLGATGDVTTMAATTTLIAGDPGTVIGVNEYRLEFNGTSTESFNARGKSGGGAWGLLSILHIDKI